MSVIPVIPGDPYGRTAPRLTISDCRYWAAEGRAQEAALAWAFDMKHWMKRGVGEQPDVLTTRADVVHGSYHSWYGPGWYARYEDGPSVFYLHLNFYAAPSVHVPAPVTIYHVRGLITTTHPGDTQPVAIWDKGSAWSLDYSLDEQRQRILRSDLGPRWDGS